MTHEKPKILLGPSSFAELDRGPLEALKKLDYEIVDNPYKRKLTKDEILTLLSENVVGLIAGLEPLDKAVLEHSRLKVISRVGSGLSNIDLDAADKLGIKICSTPDGPTEAVSELTLGVLLNLIRMVPQMDSDLHQGKWRKKIGVQLKDKTIAIIGFGKIGRRLAELLSPFQVKILVVDPFLDKNSTEYSVVSLETALSQADVVTIHSSGDKCLLGDYEFSIMKDGMFLLNAARGGLISEPSLIKALDDGKVAGAWLDTFSNEPYQGELASYTQVILTPHVGSYTLECRKQMEMEAVENLINALQH
jgi:D-3-phosphoglycerate dehydrogenase / 2-oxoglutarate reductase